MQSRKPTRSARKDASRNVSYGLAISLHVGPWTTKVGGDLCGRVPPLSRVGVALARGLV